MNTNCQALTRHTIRNIRHSSIIHKQNFTSCVNDMTALAYTDSAAYFLRYHATSEVVDMSDNSCCLHKNISQNPVDFVRLVFPEILCLFCILISLIRAVLDAEREFPVYTLKNKHIKKSHRESYGFSYISSLSALQQGSHRSISRGASAFLSCRLDSSEHRQK